MWDKLHYTMRLTFTNMMTSSNGNIFRVTGPLCREFTGPGEFPAQRPVPLSFDVFFHLRLNKRLSKQPRGWWFETPPWSWWRQCNERDLHWHSGSRVRKTVPVPVNESRSIWVKYIDVRPQRTLQRVNRMFLYRVRSADYDDISWNVFSITEPLWGDLLPVVRDFAR